MERINNVIDFYDYQCGTKKEKDFTYIRDVYFDIKGGLKITKAKRRKAEKIIEKYFPNITFENFINNY